MHEHKKIKEAEYFLAKMDKNKTMPEFFEYNLSAFLSAARSVLLYALKESQSKPRGQKWYDNSLTQILKFFRDERDVNIHAEPVNTRKNPHLTIDVTIGTSVSVSRPVEVPGAKDSGIQKMVEQDSKIVVPPKHQNSGSNITLSYDYFFDDWTGSEDVLTLCKKYVAEIKTFVQDGVSRKFISG